MACHLCEVILNVGARADQFSQPLMSSFATFGKPIVKAVLGLWWTSQFAMAGLTGQWPPVSTLALRALLAIAVLVSVNDIATRGKNSLFYTMLPDFIVPAGSSVATSVTQSVSGLPNPGLPSSVSSPSATTTKTAEQFGYVEYTFFDTLTGLMRAATNVNFSFFHPGEAINNVIGIILIVILVIPLVLVIGMFLITLLEGLFMTMSITIPAWLWYLFFIFDKTRAIGVVAVRFYGDVALTLMFAGIGIAFLLAPVRSYATQLNAGILQGATKLLDSWDYWSLLFAAFAGVGLVPAAKMLAANFSGANSSSSMGSAIAGAASGTMAVARNAAGAATYGAGSAIAARTGGGGVSQAMMRSGYVASAGGSRRWIESMERRKGERIQSLNDASQERGDTPEAAALRARTRTSYRN